MTYCEKVISVMKPLMKDGTIAEIEDSPAAEEQGFVNFTTEFLNEAAFSGFNEEKYREVYRLLYNHYNNFARNIVIRSLFLLTENAELKALGTIESKIASDIGIALEVFPDNMRLYVLFTKISSILEIERMQSALNIIEKLALVDVKKIYQKFLNTEISIIKTQSNPSKTDRYVYLAPMLSKISEIEYELEMTAVVDLNVYCAKMTIEEFVQFRILKIKEMLITDVSIKYIEEYVSFLEKLLVVNANKKKHIVYTKKKMSVIIVKK